MEIRIQNVLLKQNIMANHLGELVNKAPGTPQPGAVLLLVQAYKSFHVTHSNTHTYPHTHTHSNTHTYPHTDTRLTTDRWLTDLRWACGFRHVTVLYWYCLFIERRVPVHVGVESTRDQWNASGTGMSHVLPKWEWWWNPPWNETIWWRQHPRSHVRMLLARLVMSVSHVPLRHVFDLRTNFGRGIN